MRAISVADYGPAEVLREIDAPMPDAAPGAVRIRVRAIGVNPADVKWRSGALQAMSQRELPFVPGYDVAGEVDAVGAGVSGFAVGDRVFGALNPLLMGAYAEYAVSDPLFLAKMPAGLDFAVASAL